MEVKVVITLAPDVKDILERLVGKIDGALSTKTDVSYTKEPVKKEEDNINDTEEAESVTENKVQPSVTIEEIRSLAAKAIKKDRDKTKEILTSFGASSVSTLDEEHYDAFYEKIGELV